MWCILQSLLSRLDYDGDGFATVLTSLGQVAKLQPSIFATRFKEVIKDFVINKLMVVDRVCSDYCS